MQKINGVWAIFGCRNSRNYKVVIPGFRDGKTVRDPGSIRNPEIDSANSEQCYGRIFIKCLERQLTLQQDTISQTLEMIWIQIRLFNIAAQGITNLPVAYKCVVILAFNQQTALLDYTKACGFHHPSRRAINSDNGNSVCVGAMNRTSRCVTVIWSVLADVCTLTLSAFLCYARISQHSLSRSV